MKIAALSGLCVVMVGCSTVPPEYYMAVTEANRMNFEIQQARYQAEAARYTAIASVAKDGDATSQAIAVVSMSMMSGSAQQAPASQGTVMPQQPQNEALQWASVLAGPLTHLGLGMINKSISINANDNARDIQLNTNAMIGGFGDNVMRGSTYGYEYVNPTPVITPEPTVVIVQPSEPIIVEPFIVEPFIVPTP